MAVSWNLFKLRIENIFFLFHCFFFQQVYWCAVTELVAFRIFISPEEHIPVSYQVTHWKNLACLEIRQLDTLFHCFLSLIFYCLAVKVWFVSWVMQNHSNVLWTRSFTVGSALYYTHSVLNILLRNTSKNYLDEWSFLFQNIVATHFFALLLLILKLKVLSTCCCMYFSFFKCLQSCSLKWLASHKKGNKQVINCYPVSNKYWVTELISFKLRAVGVI